MSDTVEEVMHRRIVELEATVDRLVAEKREALGAIGELSEDVIREAWDEGVLDRGVTRALMMQSAKLRQEVEFLRNQVRNLEAERRAEPNPRDLESVLRDSGQGTGY